MAGSTEAIPFSLFQPLVAGPVRRRAGRGRRGRGEGGEGVWSTWISEVAVEANRGKTAAGAEVQGASPPRAQTDKNSVTEAMTN